MNIQQPGVGRCKWISWPGLDGCSKKVPQVALSVTHVLGSTLQPSARPISPQMTPHSALHTPTYRLNAWLFMGFLWLAVALGADLPHRYPIHFGLTGTPDAWAQGPSMWVLLVAVCAISIGQLHFLQRFLVVNPDGRFLNIPHKKLFLELPRQRRLVVVRRVNRLLGLVNSCMILTYSAVLLLIWSSAHNPTGVGAKVANFVFLAVLAGVVVIPLVEAWGLSRMVKRKLREEGLLT